MKKKVLITSMGGYGSLSVVNGLSYKNRKKIEFFGTHNDAYLLKRAEKICKKIFLVPGVINQKKYFTILVVWDIYQALHIQLQILKKKKEFFV